MAFKPHDADTISRITLPNSSQPYKITFDDSLTYFINTAGSNNYLYVSRKGQGTLKCTPKVGQKNSFC